MFNSLDKNNQIVNSYIKKPQKLFKSKENYYVARDIFKDVNYICYKNLLMIDIDFYKSNDFTNSINKIINFVNNNKQYLFRIYLSNNGLHVFCLSHTFEYHQESTVNFMLFLNCDFMYALLAYSRGFCVRLNSKDGKKLKYKFLADIGTGTINKELEYLTNMHILWTKIFN